MTTYYTYQLPNALRLVVQPIAHSPVAVVNVLYHVGSCNEDPNRTGLAHYFEHVMFGGSANVPSYDVILEQVGGLNNAYTSSDVTNYWCKLPANQVETALFLEADRMLAPNYSPHTLETQRKVVIEEFKQTCLNKPYGDFWHLLSAQAYQKHPYQWPTLGKDISHIEKITTEDVIALGERFYNPKNAILVVVGGVAPEAIYQLTQTWFGDIPNSPYTKSILPIEPTQNAPKYQTVTRKVPQDALYKTYHTPPRTHPHYPAYKLLSTLLSHGNASILHRQLVEEQQIFTEIHTYPTESLYPGLFVIEGRLQAHATLPQADKALQKIVEDIMAKGISSYDLQKAKNQEDATYLLDKMDLVEKAEFLAYATLFGDTDFFDKEMKTMQALEAKSLQEIAIGLFDLANSHTLYYQAAT